jgi:hypothetical protein
MAALLSASRATGTYDDLHVRRARAADRRRACRCAALKKKPEAVALPRYREKSSVRAVTGADAED